MFHVDSILCTQRDRQTAKASVASRDPMAWLVKRMTAGQQGPKVCILLSSPRIFRCSHLHIPSRQNGCWEGTRDCAVCVWCTHGGTTLLHWQRRRGDSFSVVARCATTNISRAYSRTSSHGVFVNKRQDEQQLMEFPFAVLPRSASQLTREAPFFRARLLVSIT
jgi:hypothetical protein